SFFAASCHLHTLPSFPTRRSSDLVLTNLARDGLPRVRLVLAGSASLEERLASPKLASLAQRISARGYLQPLSNSETAAYVRSQRSEEHTSELQSPYDLVCRLLLEK